jgi:hypothetical protein
MIKSVGKQQRKRKIMAEPVEYSQISPLSVANYDSDEDGNNNNTVVPARRPLDHFLNSAVVQKRTWCIVAVFVASFVVAIPSMMGYPLISFLGLRDQNKHKPSLEFRQVDEDKWKFKILQIADIHLGEAEHLDWGAEQDRKTWIALDKVLRMEDPDLIVLSGDQLTANNCETNATAYYQVLGNFLSEYSIPWAMIFGNHDDMSYELPDGSKRPAKYSRKQLLEVDQSFALSLSQEGPSTIFGTTNYILDIHIHEQPAAQIYFLDTGGGSLPEELEQNQVDWLLEESSPELPAVAFQHIPTIQFKHSENCQGFKGEEGIASLQVNDPGIVQTLSDLGRVSFLAVGHQHGNDYCCPFSETLNVCFARHSGYGGYGRLDRGARIYELTIDDPDSRSLQWWESWVRLESGEVIDNVSP